jgi:hypothetical protein
LSEGAAGSSGQAAADAAKKLADTSESDAAKKLADATKEAEETATTTRRAYAGKFSVKYKDDPNWWTHSLLHECYGKDKHWVLLGLPSRDSA